MTKVEELRLWVRSANKVAEHNLILVIESTVDGHAFVAIHARYSGHDPTSVYRELMETNVDSELAASALLNRLEK